jgi:hypothetical protein
VAESNLSDARKWEIARQRLALMERKARSATGMILALASFAATYGLLLYEGQTARPGFHFYPLMTGLCFYVAGDLLAMVWFRVIVLQLQRMLREGIETAPPQPTKEPLAANVAAEAGGLA